MRLRSIAAIGFVCSVGTFAIATATTLPAQEWRTLESSRQVRDSQPLDVHVRYGAGTLRLSPSNDRMLYHMHLRYNAEHSEPSHSFDAAEHTLTIGLEKGSNAGLSFRGGRDGELDLSLARGVPMSLKLDVGAVKGTLELGGLAVQDMELHTGASEVKARFGSLNTIPMSHLNISSGAASVTIESVGNANTRDIDVNVGVGSITLDFGGDWAQDRIDLQASVAVGGLTLRVPRDVAIDIDMQRTLASFKREGFEQQGKHYVTTSTQNSTRKLRISGSAALGSVEIIRY